jgi:predicted transcriptional regulator
MNSQDFHRTMIINGRVLKYRLLGRAILDNYKLAYNAYSNVRQGGVLDIEKCEGNQVMGILYDLSDEGLKRVDIREGSLYERIVVEVNLDNKKVRAYTYMVKQKSRTKANIKYSGIVYRAMLEYKFTQKYIDDFVKLVRISAYGSEENYFKYKENREKVLK